MSEIRPRRSVLAMPGSRATMEAAGLPTDAIPPDLEDGVAAAMTARGR